MLVWKYNRETNAIVLISFPELIECYEWCNDTHYAHFPAFHTIHEAICYETVEDVFAYLYFLIGHDDSEQTLNGVEDETHLQVVLLVEVEAANLDYFMSTSISSTMWS